MTKKTKAYQEILLDIQAKLEEIRCRLIDIEKAADDDTYRSITAKEGSRVCPKPRSFNLS
jgi:hypothetical protein